MTVFGDMIQEQADDVIEASKHAQECMDAEEVLAASVATLDAANRYDLMLADQINSGRRSPDSLNLDRLRDLWDAIAEFRDGMLRFAKKWDSEYEGVKHVDALEKFDIRDFATWELIQTIDGHDVPTSRNMRLSMSQFVA